MIRRLSVAATLLIVTGLPHAAAADSAFARMFTDYEAIRQALIQDSTAGVADRAGSIRSIALRLGENFDADVAGVAGRDAAAARELLPEIADRAGRLAGAQGLAAVRAELAELTKPMVRYHALVQGARPVVAYCPMERKAWLQPDEPIGNPYDPSMLRCGEVVAR